MNDEEVAKAKRVLEGLGDVIGRLGGLWNLYPMRDDVEEQVKTAQAELIEIRKDLIRVGLVNRTLYDNPRLGRKKKSYSETPGTEEDTT